MSKVMNEKGERMSNEEIALELAQMMPIEHKLAIQPTLVDSLTNEENVRRNFAHAVLDSYSQLATDTQEQERSKKSCLYLMNKYMKSTATPTDAEIKAMQKLVDTIKSASPDTSAE